MNKSLTIYKLKDKNFQGFYCCKCERELKHAYGIKGVAGWYGSECIYKVAGLDYTKTKKQIKKLNTLAKRWAYILEHRKMYSLDLYIEFHGSLEKVEEIFYKYGNLR